MNNVSYCVIHAKEWIVFSLSKGRLLRCIIFFINLLRFIQNDFHHGLSTLEYKKFKLFYLFTDCSMGIKLLSGVQAVPAWIHSLYNRWGIRPFLFYNHYQISIIFLKQISCFSFLILAQAYMYLDFRQSIFVCTGMAKAWMRQCPLIIVSLPIDSLPLSSTRQARSNSYRGQPAS